MAFAETRAARTVLDGICPVEVTLAEAVYAGDCLGISGATWVLSAHATAEQPILVASVSAPSGAKIQAYPMAVVQVTVNTATTVGEKVALHDSGHYVNAGSNLPDVGFSISSDTLIVCPSAAQLTVPRT